MKKIIVMFSLVLILGLGACASSSNATLENRVSTLETQVAELESILVDLQVIEGLNGQREYYIPQQQTASIFTSVSASTVESMGTELDKTKAPTYVLDENEDYIPFADVVNLLVDKYFPSGVTVNTAIIGFQIKIGLNVNTISQDEYMARIILLINELSNYDFYIIGGSELYIQLSGEMYGYIKVPIQTMRSSFITITPEVIYKGIYEVQLSQTTINEVTVQSLYDEYIASGLYVGYVLNYTN